MDMGTSASKGSISTALRHTGNSSQADRGQGRRFRRLSHRLALRTDTPPISNSRPAISSKTSWRVTLTSGIGCSFRLFKPSGVRVVVFDPWRHPEAYFALFH